MAFFGKSDSQDTKARLKEQTQQEFAVADVTQLVNNMTKQCFEICFSNPGSSVSSGENQCTKDCAKKYMAAWDIVSTNYVHRLK